MYIVLSRALGVLLLCSLCAGHAAASLSLWAIGDAYDAVSQELLYRETYFCSQDVRQCRVEYRKIDGNLIATKTLDYGTDPTAPLVRFLDERSGQERELALPVGKRYVIDAGFDNFVRSRWDDLLSGERVRFSFQPLGFDRPFTMRAEVDSSDCDSAQLCIRVQVDSWLLGLVAKPLALQYSRDTRQLLRYNGISNLRIEDGEAPQVDIRYTYP